MEKKKKKKRITTFVIVPFVLNILLLGKQYCKCSISSILQNGYFKLILPEPCPASRPSWFGFLITCREGVDRNRVVQYVEEKGIQTRMLFAGNLTRHPCFDPLRQSGNGYRIVGELKIADRIMRDTFWVGVYPGMTDAMIDTMEKVIHEAVRQA